MAMKTVYEIGTMLEIARGLLPLEQEITLSLHDRGPAAPLEIAVRVLKFPDEVAKPIADLREKRVVEVSEMPGATYGKSFVALTPQGEHLANLLRDDVFVKEIAQADVASDTQPAPDPRQQEVELLQKLGNLAERNGDLAKASTYYEQALQASRASIRATLT